MRIAVVLAGLLTFIGAAAFAATDKPNVLFLICDDLNCDLGCYGHPAVESPHIDALARRGVRFENAFCQYPLCGPSRASFMTGLYPDQTRIHKNAVRVRDTLPRVVTMTQYFREHGYFATRVGKIYHYSNPSHIGTAGHDDPDSWDYTVNPRGRDKDDEPLINTLRPGKFGGTLSWLAADGDDLQQTDGIGATEAIGLLQEYAHSRQPFFLAVGLYRPHTPYVAPKKYFAKYRLSDMQIPDVPRGYLATLPPAAQRTLTRKREQLNLPAETARKVLQAYYATITFCDAQIGRVLAALDQTGLADNTIVIFTSDHGYHMGEHGHWQKTTLFENAARVPLIIAPPRRSGGGVQTAALAEMVDFYPTLIDLCHLPEKADLAGKSLTPVLNDPQARVRDSALTQYESGYTLRTDHYRFTQWGAEGAELYDRRSDPQELKNLASEPEYEGVVAELRATLDARIARTQ